MVAQSLLDVDAAAAMVAPMLQGGLASTRVLLVNSPPARLNNLAKRERYKNHHVVRFPEKKQLHFSSNVMFYICKR